MLEFYCFFFQAEDGIRDDLVTGVQTCALPIYRLLHPRGRRFLSTIPSSPGPLGPSAYSRIPSRAFPKTEIGNAHGSATLGSSPIFLHQNSQEGLEPGGDPLPENDTSLTNDLEPGRSGATDRCSSPSLASHFADGPLRHRTPACGTPALKSERHRQSAHGDSRARRQRTQRPGRNAQSHVARRTPPTLAPVATKAQ